MQGKCFAKGGKTHRCAYSFYKDKYLFDWKYFHEIETLS